MLRDDEVDDVLEAIELHFVSRLTHWEREFIESIRDRWEEQRTLTDRQRAKVEAIFERFAPGRG